MNIQQSTKMLLLATLFVASGWSAEAAELELRSDAVVAGSVVRLGDIARIRNAEAELVAEWEALPLFPAPAIGKSRLVRPQELSQLLAFSDERLADCRIVGASAVQIHSRDEGAGTAKPLALHAAYRPAATNTQAVAPASHTEIAAKTHTASRIAVAGNLPISTAETVAVVALRKLDRGQTIRREDVALQQVSAEFAEAGAITDLGAVIGREATQAIHASGLISAKMVQMPRLVRRGETVTIRSIAAGIRITTSGKALEDGSEGALISVDLDETHERIAARVVGVQQVEVYANGPRVPSPKSAASAPAPQR
jgi:flagella basal body P-ring formation protein FlgA